MIGEKKRARGSHTAPRVAAVTAALLASIVLPISSAQALTRIDTAPPRGFVDTNPVVANGPGGDAAIVWFRHLDGGEQFQLQSSARTHGGVWQPPVNLTGPDQGGFSAVAFDGQDRAIVAWGRKDGIHTSDGQGGAWQPSGGVPRDYNCGGRLPDMAIDAAGNAVVVWAELYNGASAVRVMSASRPAGGAWQAPVELSSPDHQENQTPKVALDGNGDATAVWSSRVGDGPARIQAAHKPHDGPWGAPIDVSADGQGAIQPVLAVSANGAATVAWLDALTDRMYVQAASRPAGAAWREPVRISAVGQDAASPQIAANAAGQGAIMWAQSRAPGTAGGTIDATSVQVSNGTVGAGWQSPDTLYKQDFFGGIPLNVAVADDGATTALWDGFSNKRNHLLAATRPAGGAWRSAAELASSREAFSDPHLVLDRAGRATAVVETAGGIAVGDVLRAPVTAKGPVVALASLGHQALATVLRKGFRARVRSTPGGNATLRLTVAGAVVATGKRTLLSGTTTAIVARFGSAARRRFAHRRTLKLRMELVVSDADGNRTVSRRTLTLAR